MDYISVNDFLKQSEKMQENLLKWWKENVKQYDIFYRKSKIEGYRWSGRQKYIVTKVKRYKLETITLRNKKIEAGRDAWTEQWDIQYINDIVPLLTETQLRKFIEEKLKIKINVRNTEEGYLIYHNNYNILSDLDNLKDDLLKGYWQVACKIAEDI